MIKRILAFSVHQRWLVVLLTFAASALGVWSLSRLPIDAVPDITNNQVQINTVAPSLSPYDVEKQVTFPIETALAGIPGLEYTRSLSRNGFSQVTAVFKEKLDIYFARQQVNERLAEAKATLPLGAEVRMGPISTGLGEIYMWTVHYRRPDGGAPVKDGRPGWQSDGTLSDPRRQAPHDRNGTRRLSARGAGLDHSPAAQDGARRRGRRRDRRVFEALSGAARPIEAHQSWAIFR